MAQNSAEQPPHITIQALLTRQLTDWQNLKAELESKQVPPAQLEYCQAQIDRLKGELNGLDGQ